MALERFKKIEPQKRQRLLQAAAQEFAAAGFQKASLGRIAEGAGVSKPALYYYFEDKADLFVTVVREAWERLSPQKLDLATLDAGTFWPALEGLRDANLAQCREEPWLVAVGRLAYSPPQEAGPASAVAEMFEGARAFLRAVLRRGQELGTVRGDLPDELLITMLTAADTAADHWMVDHWERLGSEEAERIARTVFEAVRALMSPSPAKPGEDPA
ncbi:MAG: TetR/AcrR family transcriptional regulator [Thermoanaerobaculia bacterium]